MAGFCFSVSEIENGNDGRGAYAAIAAEFSAVRHLSFAGYTGEGKQIHPVAAIQKSGGVLKRNDRILYYDCTNYYFEIEEESGLRQYGISKEHRPNTEINFQELSPAVFLRAEKYDITQSWRE